MSPMSEFDAAESIELLQAMIGINTTNPPGNESGLTKWLADWLKARGVESEIVEIESGRSNLVVTLRGKTSDRALLYTGHLDTVPPGQQQWLHDPFGGEIVGDYLYGRGASDMKSGLAAMLYSFVLLKRQGFVPEQDLILLATAGEEVNCLGARTFVAAGGMKNVVAAVVGEPSNGDVIVAHKGAAWLEITTRGSTAQVSMPH